MEQLRRPKPGYQKIFVATKMSYTLLYFIEKISPAKISHTFPKKINMTKIYYTF